MDLEFHHIGVACSDLERETAVFEMLGYEREGADFEDPRQGIRGRFVVGTGPRMELLEPLGDAQTLEPWLRVNTKMYHQAFQVSDMESGIEVLRARRARVVVPPVPAVAFGGRSIAFLILPTMMLVELIERTRID